MMNTQDSIQYRYLEQVLSSTFPIGTTRPR